MTEKTLGLLEVAIDTPAAARSSLIVDSQVHVWLPEGPGRPWPWWGQEFRAEAHRPELSAESLLQEMSEAGVDRAVLVPPLFEGYRNDYVLDVARTWHNRFRVMARLDLDASDLIAQLDTFAADPLVAGIRLVFLPLDLGFIGDSIESKLWAAAAERDMPLMVHCPGQLSELRVVARRHPRLRLAVDHMGLSGLRTDADVSTEILALLELGREPGVSVKLSALSCYSAEPYPHSALHGPVAAVIDAFGVERTFWGSDLSRLRGRYRDSVDMVRDHLGLDADDADHVLGGSLLDWLRWCV